MHYKRWALLVCVAMLVTLVGSASAQQDTPPGQPQALASPVTTVFTYQGQVKKNSGAYTGVCDFRFTLWDAASAGAQQGPTRTPAGVKVTNGLFTVELDFGDQFKGDARWLQVAVDCGDGAFTTMDPRILMTSSPYALSLRPGATISGTGATGLVVNTPNGNPIAGYTQANGYSAVYGGDSSAAGGFGLRGLSNKGIGVLGQSTDGSGIVGKSNTWIGVYGESVSQTAVSGKSTNATGVYGSSGAYVGVWGETNADSVSGVVGQGKDPCPTGSPPICYSIYQRNANGVAGEALAEGYGVWGRSARGISVAGFAPGYDRPDLNTYGFSAPAGMFGGVNGVIGYTKGGGNGVSGVATTASGTGVYGYNFAGGYATQFFGKTATTVLEIRGGSDLAELFNVSENTAEPGTLMIIDQDNPGHLTVSVQAYDTQVAGIVSGAGGVNPGLTLHQAGVMEGDTHVAIAGRVYVKATAANGSIKPGDLLTTSDLMGHAMKATDRERAQGAVIGKAMTSLESGTGLVLVLVNLQ